MPAPFRTEPFTNGLSAALWLPWVVFGHHLADALETQRNRGRVERRSPLGEDIARALTPVRRRIGLWLAVYLFNGAPCA